MLRQRRPIRSFAGHPFLGPGRPARCLSVLCRGRYRGVVCTAPARIERGPRTTEGTSIALLGTTRASWDRFGDDVMARIGWYVLGSLLVGYGALQVLGRRAGSTVEER